MAWPDEVNASSYWSIEKLVPDPGVIHTVHAFAGQDHDLAKQTYNRMKKLYDSLPEFPQGYFERKYTLVRRSFATRETLDRYPVV